MEGLALINPTEEEIVAAFPRPPWDHQRTGLVDLFAKGQDKRMVVLCSPTGGGKGLMQSAIINLLEKQRKGAVIYNCRRLLTTQSYERLQEDGIDFGVRAAGIKNLQDLNARVQVSSLQTDVQRVLNQQCWDIHDCDIVIVDEAHLCMSAKYLELFQKYLANGATIIGVTGTPVGMSAMYQDIAVAGTNSQLRACKSHVPARTFSCSEMDTSKIKPTKTGEYREGDIIKECWSHAVVGYIYNDYRRLNPDGKPALAAGPDVDSAIWISEEFLGHGHRVLHIDAKEVIVNGERYKNDAAGKVRNQALDDFRKGEFDILTNCEVIQQGIDLPNLHHLILARPYGSLANYLQTCGRVIRYSDETPNEVIIQDHAGNIYRHGSANEDRDWDRLFFMNEKEIQKERKRNIEEGKIQEPISCIKCGKVRPSGTTCPACGHKSEKRSRAIIQKDGSLVEVEGKFYKERKKSEDSIEQKRWDKLFWQTKKSRHPNPRSFKAMAHIYKNKYGSWPPWTLKRMPLTKEVWNESPRWAEWQDLS